MTAAVEADIQNERGTLVKFLQSSKHAMHGFTHTGKHAISRRFYGRELGSYYSEEDVVRGIRLALALGVFAVCEMTAHAGAEGVARSALELAKTVA